jgi:predicted AAA+ superfamily ATPase
MAMIPEYILKVLTLDNSWLEGSDIKAWYSHWLPDQYIERSLNIETDQKVCLVVGPRQAGKSTLIWKKLSESGGPCLYLNCEEPAIREWLVSPAAFLADIKGLTEGTIPLFFDEIQHLTEPGLFLKGLVDRRSGHTLFATGSSSFDLEAATRESLAGRANRHLLLPLSLHEVSNSLKGPPALMQQKKLRSCKQLLIHGGYPPVYTSIKPLHELTGLVESFVIRDASDRFKIKRPAAFRKIMELSASQIGNLCNYSEWGAIAGISSDTAKEYAGILEDTHILRLIRPYVGGKRAEITSTPKVYYVDNGIRNQVFGGFSEYDVRPDRGVLMENFAFTELYKRINPILDSIKFWRSKAGAEVDFVVEHKGAIAAAVEIKAGDCRGKITKSSRSFIDAYHPPHFYVVNDNIYPDTLIEKTPVRFITPDRVDEIEAEGSNLYP